MHRPAHGGLHLHTPTLESCHVTELSDRLAEAKGNDSIDAIAERAAASGHKIDRATVGRYVAGDGAKNPPDKVLRALAAGLGLDVRELRTLAGKPSGELGPWTPPDEAARLSRDQRKALDQLIKSIVGKDVRQDAAPTIQAGGRPAKSASDGHIGKDELDELRRRQEEADAESVEHIIEQAAETRDEGD